MQTHLQEFNKFFDELQEKKVGIFAVCAQDQGEVDETMKEWELKFQVRSNPLPWH